jgi:hypothetical protein
MSVKCVKRDPQIDLLRKKETYVLVQNISNLIDGLFLLLGTNSSSSSGAQLGLHCMVCVFSKLLAACEDVRVRERVCVH